MEYAQILLDNLSCWPEHFQLVGALHRVEPRKAYEEVKQLALSIEQSRIMFGANERRSLAWKNSEERSIGAEGMNTSGHNHQRQEPSYREASQSRKCYHCERFGHIARECSNKAFGTKDPKSEIRRKRPHWARIVIPLKFLGERRNALVDTGSLINIIPLKVLARPQDRGNRMNFVAAVYAQVETEKGQPERIAFHISPDREEETMH
ncbi:zinc knuckle [Cooperia oncophora]